MKKNFRSILTMVLCLVLVLTAVVPVAAYALEASSGPAAQSSTTIVSEDYGWLKFEQTEDADGKNTVTVTVSPDLASLADISRADVKEILAKVIAIAKDIIVDELMGNVSTDGSTGGSFTSDELLATLFKGYLDNLDGYEGDDYIEFFKDALAEGENSQLIADLADYISSQIEVVHSAGIVTKAELESFSVDAAKIETALMSFVGADFDADEYIDAVTAYILDGTEPDSAIKDSAIFANAKESIVAMIKTAAENVINAENAGGVFENLIGFDNLTLANAIKNADADDCIEAIADLVDDGNRADIEAEIKAECENKAYEAFVGVDKDTFEACVDKYCLTMSVAYNSTVGALTDIESAGISISALVSAFQSLTIDGLTVIENANINMSAVKALLRTIPMPYEIAQMADDEMQLGYDISVGTTFGSCDFRIVAKVGGGYGEIRAICGIISEYIDVSLEGDNTLNVDITIPEIVSKAVLKLANSDKLPDDLKQKVFAAFEKDGTDFYAAYMNLGFDDIQRIISLIDFEDIIDSQTFAKYYDKYIKRYLGEKADLSELTNEQIEYYVNKLEGYFNLAKKYADKVVNIAYNKLSNDYPQYLDNDFFSVFEHDDPNDHFSYSDGLFHYDGTHSVRYGYFVENIQEYLGKLCDKIENSDGVVGPIGPIGAVDISSLEKLDEYFDLLVQYLNIDLNDTVTLSLDLDVKVENIRKVTYNKLNGDKYEATNGMLPAGADINFFGNYSPEGFLGWIDSTGKLVTTMPAEDIELWPLIAGKVTITSADINKTYNGVTETLTAIAGVDNLENVVYQWYKVVGNAAPELIEGATSSTITVLNVADSAVYYCTATDALNNKDLGESNKVTVNIAKAEVKVELTANGDVSFVYTGSEITVGYNAPVFNPDNFNGIYISADDYTVTGDKATEIGKYECEFTFTNGNYAISADSTASFEWEIVEDNQQPIDPPPAQPTEHDLSIELKDVAWIVTYYTNGNATLNEVIPPVYSAGSTHYALIDLEATKEAYASKTDEASVKIYNLLLMLDVADNVYTAQENAGIYTSSVSFAIKSDYAEDHIIKSGKDSVNYEWEIYKQSVLLSELALDKTTFVYNGTEYSVNVTGLETLVNDGIITITHSAGSQNKGTNVDEYTVFINVRVNNSNYALSDAGLTVFEKVGSTNTESEYNLKTAWDITPYGIDVNEILGAYTGNTALVADENGDYILTVQYADGTNYSIKFVTKLDQILDIDLADIVKIDYILNTKDHNSDTCTQNMIGKYTFTAKVTIINDNFVFANEVEELTAILKIEGSDKTGFSWTDANGEEAVKVTVVGGLSPDHKMEVTDITASVEPTYELDGKTLEVLAAFDITFNKDVNGNKFTVQLLIPAEYRDLDDDELMVIWIRDDGSVVDMEAVRKDHYMEFETDHFSKYAIVKVKSANLLWLWILLAVLAAAGIAVLVVFLVKKYKEKNKAPAPDALVVPEAAENSEQPAEETAAEETPEVVEIEEVVEEEEAPAEVAEIDEAPIAEEEIEAPVEEETAEEAPIEEAPAEEPVAAIAEEPKSVAIVIEDNTKVATAVIGGQTVLIRFRRSYMSRLIQSTDKVQGFYSAIKNHLMSYKGIKARGSWNYEAFNKGRVQCAKLNVKGKTLIVNLNLNPEDFNINKYHFVDCSAKPKYAKVPLMMKVRSDRALKYTLELIDEMMNALGAQKLDIPAVDYRMPYETTEELAKRGLVKIILPAGVTLSDDMHFVQMNVSELIESGNVQKTTEQTMEEAVAAAPVEEAPIEEAPVEEAPVEEAPAEEAPVEEAPVEEAPVEEAPVEETPVEETPVEETPVEEAPVEEAPVEEAPVEEAPAEEAPVEEEIHVDAITADQLVTDEEAQSQIEIIHTEANRSGKVGEINLDIICENFEDGDVVDVESLKAKRLISSKIGKVKILARGIMTKKLTVKASKFSLQAVKMIHLAGGKAELED